MCELLQIDLGGWPHWLEFIKDFVIPIASAILAAIIALWLYRRQIKNEKKKEKKRRMQVRNDKLLYFSALVKGCIEIAAKQNELLKDYMKKIDEDPINLKPLSKIVWQDLQRISQKLDLEDYLVAYADYYKGERRTTIKEFKEIVGSIDLFYEIFCELQNVVERTIKHTYNKKLEIQKYQQMTFTVLNNFVFHLYNTNREKYNEFNLMMKPFSEKNKDENIKYSFEYFYTDFFIPLYDFTSKYLSTPIDNFSHAEEILQYAKMGKEGYELLKDEAIVFNRIIKTDYDKVDEYIIKVKEKSEHLLSDFI